VFALLVFRVEAQSVFDFVLDEETQEVRIVTRDGQEINRIPAARDAISVSLAKGDQQKVAACAALRDPQEAASCYRSLAQGFAQVVDQQEQIVALALHPDERSELFEELCPYPGFSSGEILRATRCREGMVESKATDFWGFSPEEAKYLKETVTNHGNYLSAYAGLAGLCSRQLDHSAESDVLCEKIHRPEEDFDFSHPHPDHPAFARLVQEALRSFHENQDKSGHGNSRLGLSAPMDCPDYIPQGNCEVEARSLSEEKFGVSLQEGLYPIVRESFEEDLTDYIRREIYQTLLERSLHLRGSDANAYAQARRELTRAHSCRADAEASHDSSVSEPLEEGLLAEYFLRRSQCAQAIYDRLGEVNSELGQDIELAKTVLSEETIRNLPGGVREAVDAVTSISFLRYPLREVRYVTGLQAKAESECGAIAEMFREAFSAEEAQARAQKCRTLRVEQIALERELQEIAQQAPTLFEENQNRKSLYAELNALSGLPSFASHHHRNLDRFASERSADENGVPLSCLDKNNFSPLPEHVEGFQLIQSQRTPQALSEGVEELKRFCSDPEKTRSAYAQMAIMNPHATGAYFNCDLSTKECQDRQGYAWVACRYHADETLKQDLKEAGGQLLVAGFDAVGVGAAGMARNTLRVTAGSTLFGMGVGGGLSAVLAPRRENILAEQRESRQMAAAHLADAQGEARNRQVSQILSDEKWRSVLSGTLAGTLTFGAHSALPRGFRGPGGISAVSRQSGGDGGSGGPRRLTGKSDAPPSGLSEISPTASTSSRSIDMRRSPFEGMSEADYEKVLTDGVGDLYPSGSQITLQQGHLGRFHRVTLSERPLGEGDYGIVFPIRENPDLVIKLPTTRRSIDSFREEEALSQLYRQFDIPHAEVIPCQGQCSYLIKRRASGIPGEEFVQNPSNWTNESIDQFADFYVRARQARFSDVENAADLRRLDVKPDNFFYDAQRRQWTQIDVGLTPEPPAVLLEMNPALAHADVFSTQNLHSTWGRGFFGENESARFRFYANVMRDLKRKDPAEARSFYQELLTHDPDLRRHVREQAERN
jgi:hypothetical protein